MHGRFQRLILCVGREHFQVGRCIKLCASRLHLERRHGFQRRAVTLREGAVRPGAALALRSRRDASALMQPVRHDAHAPCSPIF